MSRIGNKPITVPEGVEVTLNDNHIVVKGPKGTLEKDLHKNMTVTMEGNTITVTRPNDEAVNRSLHGLTRTLISNMIEGVVNEFKRNLEINGVGYRAQKKGNDLVMNLGYSHPVEIVAPEGISFDLTDANHITVRGIDKELVGQTAAVIRTKDHQRYIEVKVLSMLKSILEEKKVKPARNKIRNFKLRLTSLTSQKISSTYSMYSFRNFCSVA